MFEQYDERARHSIFFARYEASQTGSTRIGSLHLLLGLLRENGYLFTRFSKNASVNDLMESCRRALPVGKETSTSVDMPLSEECKQVLVEAAKQAELLASPSIRPVHLALGLISASEEAAAILKQHGITAKQLVGDPTAEVPGSGVDRPGVSEPLPALLEFLFQGERMATTPVNFINPLPRVGDEVIFTREMKPETYKVLAVRHHFESPTATRTLAHCRLTKLVIELERTTSIAA